jgi:hypothetical protein
MQKHATGTAEGLITSRKNEEVSRTMHSTQQKIHVIQSKVMEVSQRIQPAQEKACQLFTEVESQGTELEQVVITDRTTPRRTNQ